MQSIMAEPLSFIDNSTVITQKLINHEIPGRQSTEPLPPADKYPFRRINFDLAKKPFTGYKNTNENQRIVRPESVGGGSSGKKRDASELENGLGQELSVGITCRRIGAGLENLGNTCFLNSVLQCLTYTEPLAAYLQSGKHQVTCRKSGFCALCAIQKHVSRALQLSGRSLAPKDLVSNLRCISRSFRNSRQEDAHEYMVNLLESMHKCCLPNGVPSESQRAYDNSLVHRIFGGQLRSQVKCMQCNYCSDKFDPFLDVSLEILKADSLYKAFTNFTAKEQLDGGAKQYECQQCKQKVKALKQLTVYKAPNVLTVHLKRFGCHMSGQKIDKKVHFGPTLNLKPFVTGPYDGDLKYTLYGVLVHAGWSTRSGHYYCFVRTSSGLWYSLDDNRVFQVSEKTVFEQKAYMLFYFKDRKNFLSRRPTDVGHQKTKIVKNGTPNEPGAEREVQMKTGLSNGSLNAQKPLQKTANGALQNEKIVMNSTPNGPSAEREAQMKTDPSNWSLNAQMPLQKTTDVALQKEKIVMNSTPNGPGAEREAQMKTGTSNGSLNAQMPLQKTAHVAHPKEKTVMDGTANGPNAPKETQTNFNSSNGVLSGQKSSASNETMMKGQSNGVSEPEQIQVKGTSVSKSISEPSKTEVQEPGLLKMQGSMEKKAYTAKPRARVKNFLKCKLMSMKFSSNVLTRASENQRKKRKHKRDKRVKNLDQESLTDEGLSSLVKIKAQEMVKPVVDNGFTERVDAGGAVLEKSNEFDSCRRCLSQKDLVHMLTRGIDDVAVLRWDEDESAPSQIFGKETNNLNIGYTGDEWDEEYDRGKRKKVKISRIEFDGKNSFQDIANKILKSSSEKQNLLSRRPPMKMMMKKENKHFKKSRCCNGPYRI